MRPIIKYRGGKSREIQAFSRFIPDTYNRYIEPFFGGGAVFFHLEPESAILNDVNERLMEFYDEVRNNYIELSEELFHLQTIYENNQQQYALNRAAIEDRNIRVENMNEVLYYQLRDMYNGIVQPIYSDGALYYFINKTAYSGMIRYNRQGEYNVPFGRYVHFNTRMITQEHSELLNRAQLYNQDYSDIFNQAQNDDFVFLDPPYDCTFNDYGNLDMQNGFDEEQHRRLAADFRNLNCRAMMVIARTDLIDELYGQNVVHEYAKNYAVNIRNRFNANASHIVITNYPV